MTTPSPATLKVAMAAYGDITFDSRVRREAATLARAGYSVTLYCLGDSSTGEDLPPNVAVVVHRPASTAVLPQSPNPFYSAAGRPIRAIQGRIRWLTGYVRNLRAWGAWVATQSADADMWHLHDLTALAAVGPRLHRDATVVYDSHEIFLERGTAARLPEMARLLLRRYERRLVSRVTAMVTVNESYAHVLGRRYAPRRIVVVHNCPERWTPPAVPPTRIRDAAGIPADAPVVLYHGLMTGERGIEQLMGSLLEPGMEGAHLALLGFGPKHAEYVAAAADPRYGGRLHVLAPVPPSALPEWIASADVGAMPLLATTMNHYLCTPNKLFESLTAGIPVVVSDFPTMRRIVLADPDAPLGAVCDPSDVADVARALRSIIDLDPDDTRSLRARCLRAAHDRWNWQTESLGLTGLYADLAARRASGASTGRSSSAPEASSAVEAGQPVASSR